MIELIGTTQLMSDDLLLREFVAARHDERLNLENDVD